MTTRRTSYFVSAAAAGAMTLALTAYASAAGKYYHEIDVVEHAAMLVEKMAKDAALIALHVDEGESRKEMQEAHDEFARILKGLQQGDAELQLDGHYKEKALQKDIAVVADLWPTIDAEVKEAIAAAEPSSDLMERFETHDEELYQAMERLEHHFVEMAHSDELPTIFAEGIEYTEHEATLIERMSKEYLLIAAGFHAGEMRAELNESMAEFEEILDGLIDGDMAKLLLPAPTPEIESELKKVAKMWKKFKPVLEPVAKGGKPTPDGIMTVARDNLAFVEVLEKAAHYYEQL